MMINFAMIDERSPMIAPRSRSIIDPSWIPKLSIERSLIAQPIHDYRSDPQ